jgi:AmmeMemoRadiSam system protein A
MGPLRKGEDGYVSGTTVRSDPSTLPEGWDRDEEPILLDLARRAIETKLDRDDDAGAEPESFPESLRAPRATFVTLRKDGELRGCIGSLESRSSLVESVWHNAREAAFRDPRFPPVSRDELDGLEIHVSVLSPLERLEVSDERDLLEQIRPGVDGLVLGEGDRRGTFLPAVWESLGVPHDFLTELKRKAGLAPDYWSDTIEVWRYTTYAIPS